MGCPGPPCHWGVCGAGADRLGSTAYLDRGGMLRSVVYGRSDPRLGYDRQEASQGERNVNLAGDGHATGVLSGGIIQMWRLQGGCGTSSYPPARYSSTLAIHDSTLAADYTACYRHSIYCQRFDAEVTYCSNSHCMKFLEHWDLDRMTADRTSEGVSRHLCRLILMSCLTHSGPPFLPL